MVNSATQREISIGKLAQMIISKINPNTQIISKEKRIPPPKNEVNRLLGLNKKLFKYTEWKLEYTLEKCIDRSIEWIFNNI